MATSVASHVACMLHSSAYQGVLVAASVLLYFARMTSNFVSWVLEMFPSPACVAALTVS